VEGGDRHQAPFEIGFDPVDVREEAPVSTIGNDHRRSHGWPCPGTEACDPLGDRPGAGLGQITGGVSVPPLADGRFLLVGLSEIADLPVLELALAAGGISEIEPL